MINLVRGGRVSALTLLLGIFAYAGTASAEADTTLAIANSSQPIFEESISLSEEAVITKTATFINTKDKKLVKTTASARAKGATTSSASGSFTATAYCLRGRTAMGHGVRRGIIAADPRVLRLGSTVSLSGSGYTGSYLVSDTGGRIKGKKIDIWVPSCAEAKRFGRRTVQVN